MPECFYPYFYTAQLSLCPFDGQAFQVIFLLAWTLNDFHTSLFTRSYNTCIRIAKYVLAVNVILSHFLVRPSITINKRMRLSCINVPQIYFTSYSLVTGCVWLWLSSAFIGDRKKWTNWIERRVKYEIYVLAKEVSGERVEHTIMMVSILYMTANMPNKNTREKKSAHIRTVVQWHHLQHHGTP